MFKSQSDPTKLTLSRKRQFMEANVPVDILVNGYLACQLKNGETKTINVYTHDIILLQADLMRNKTPVTEVNETDRAQNVYEVSHVISNPVYIAGVVLAIVSTILIFTTGHPAYMGLVAPPAALLLYFKFIKKDRYLKISKLRKQDSLYQPSEN